MQFRVLGDLEVEHDGRRAALGSHQQRAVLAMLVLHAGEVVSSDRLIGGLWGERPPATAAKTVQVYVSRLRRALAGPEPGTTADGPIVTSDHGYVLRVADDEIDLKLFEGRLPAGGDAFGRGAFAGAVTLLREGLALWRGPPLAAVADEPFARDEIARLEELC